MQNVHYHKKKTEYLTAVVADIEGNIFDLEGFAAVGMSGSQLTPLSMTETTPMPFGSELMLLPDRLPVVYNLETHEFNTLEFNPFSPNEKILPVAVFNSPGYVVTQICAHATEMHFKQLPLFSYGAVGWGQASFRSAAICVDKEPRQDLRLMKEQDVLDGIEQMRTALPGNRLRKHLESCALTYGCPAGKNFFLKRYEAPLPTATHCNAECLGCLSLQKQTGISCSQERIAFTPTPKEIADVALAHIKHVSKGVVSFGQGCEGDPLLASHVIAPAVERIRANTNRGTINVNTNGSLPTQLERLMAAGIDSIRISINSFRKPCYDAYFRPIGYGFLDVIKSIDLALKKGLYVSINYLNMPGFTDTPKELNSLVSFLNDYPIHRIQWRNLNYDPLSYSTVMPSVEPQQDVLGIPNILNHIRKDFPNVSFGYFNPPKEDWQGWNG